MCIRDRLYALTWPEGTTQEQTEGDDAVEAERAPLTSVPVNIIVTDEEGNETTYELDTSTGTALEEEVEPGEYTVAVEEVEGYALPEAQTVTV